MEEVSRQVTRAFGMPKTMSREKRRHADGGIRIFETLRHPRLGPNVAGLTNRNTWAKRTAAWSSNKAERTHGVPSFEARPLRASTASTRTTGFWRYPTAAFRPSIARRRNSTWFFVWRLLAGCTHPPSATVNDTAK